MALLDSERVHHIGIPVRDIERSISFYRDLIGIEADFVAASRGEAVADLVGVPEADMLFAFIPLGNVVLELLEYRNPRGGDYVLRNCDVGAVHIAFETHDLDAIETRLVEAGVHVGSGALHIDSGPLAGYATLYFRDPDGVQLEAMQTAAHH